MANVFHAYRLLKNMLADVIEVFTDTKHIEHRLSGHCLLVCTQPMQLYRLYACVFVCPVILLVNWQMCLADGRGGFLGT